MSIKVGGHRVLVRPKVLEEVDDVYASAKRAGIELASERTKREQDAIDRGTIIQIGNTASVDFDGDLWFSVGDEVVFARYSAKKVTDPETTEVFAILNAEDILCTLGE